MKRTYTTAVLLVLIMTLTQTLNSFGQIDTSFKHKVQIKRQHAVSELSNLRDKLNRLTFDNKPAVIKKLNNLIDKSRSSTDSVGLDAINHHVRGILNGLSIATTSDQKIVLANHLNTDLSRKMSALRDTSINLEQELNFGKDCTISIKATVESKDPTHGSFRIYWATFYGDQKGLALKNAAEGSSNGTGNPFELDNVLLPGEITFWMRNTQTNEIFVADIPYKEYDDATGGELELNFKKLK